MSQAQKITVISSFIALGVIGSTFLSIPLGPYRALFVQHAINVLTVVWFGTKTSVSVAFGVGLIRNLLGLGTLFAFPGGMSGALVAGLLYRLTGKKKAALAGELIGTTVLGALLSVPLSMVLTGESVFVFAFVPGFFVSSLIGVIIAGLVLVKQPHLNKQKINQ